MEKYKIVATCSNDSTELTLRYVPENFEGVKIKQSFSWINPMGYTPTASVETMRTINVDKIWLDNIFDTYGLESVVKFTIYKINSTATEQVFKAEFEVDFESYVKSDYYSEFALKAISCIDDYNEIKNTPKIFGGVLSLAIPVTQKFVNYVSLQKLSGKVNGDNTGFLTLEENEDSKMFNSDTSLATYPDLLELSAEIASNAYQFNRDASGLTDIGVSASGTMQIDFSAISGSSTAKIILYKNDYSTPIFTIHSQIITGSTSVYLEIDTKKTTITDIAFSDEDFFFVGIEISDTASVISSILGSFSLELYVKTELDANEFSRKIFYLKSETVLDSIFNDLATIETKLKTIGITSPQSIKTKLDQIALTPKNFLTDFCLANGALVNFKNDGTVNIAKIDTFFTALLDKTNAIEITDFQDVQISYDNELNFASVSVGMEKQDYDVFTYFNDWNKVLTFIQSDRAASENLNLALTKFRCDYSGILDFVTKMSNAEVKNSDDLYLFDPDFVERDSSEGIIYDQFTPRDMLTKWSKFLEFCFYNFNKDTLTLSSYGVDDSDLQIDGVNQFDDFVFSGDKIKILPWKILLSGLTDSIDFTEHILSIKNNKYMPDSFGEDIYIFVTKAETTDNLNEQEIKGNIIYFPET